MMTTTVLQNNNSTNVNTTKLSNDLANVPSQDAEFIIHLGNIVHSLGTSHHIPTCTEEIYSSLFQIFKQHQQQSKLPMFFVPDDDDLMLLCSNPKEAFGYWYKYFGHFNDKEEFQSNNYKPSSSSSSSQFDGTRQFGREENFAFIHSNVLFIGIHIVRKGGKEGEEGHTQEEWNVQYEEDVEWVQENLWNQDEPSSSYRSVILFGHARPTEEDHLNFFGPLLKDIHQLNKPILYMHASDDESDSDDAFQFYVPFAKEPRLMAVGIKSMASPVRMEVGFGENPFSLSIPSS